MFFFRPKGVVWCGFGEERRIEGAGRSRFRFQEMQLVFLLLVLLAACIGALQRNVSYRGGKRLLEPYAAETASAETVERPAECLLLWEGDELGLLGRKMMERVLSQMRIPYTSMEGKVENVKDLQKYRTIVLPDAYEFSLQM